MPPHAVYCRNCGIPVSMTPRTRVCPKCGEEDPGELRPVTSLWQIRYEIVGLALAASLILLASA